MLILHEDDPLAVEAMLTWIYTAKYPEHLFVETDGVPLWKAHLNVMIVADKYDLPALEDLALVKWQNSLGKSRLGVVPLVLQIVARSGDYADRSRRLTSHVAALCDPHFVTLNKHDSFVRWLDQHPGSSKRLVSKHFKELLSVNKFRDRLRDDGTLALEHIDRIMTETESQPKASQQKRRRTTDMAWLS